ncbi:MAG: NlpC/P60 family protein [Ignavibacteria bacterium]|nr:NlpC/P60 family protein [Ignavibacteria bacterium]
MRKSIPLVPFWLSLVLFVIALALPTNSSYAARKKSDKRKVTKRVASKKKSKKHRYRIVHVSKTKCDRVAGKKLAFDYLNNNEDLSRLAGLEPDADLTPTTDIATNTGSIAEALSTQQSLSSHIDEGELTASEAVAGSMISEGEVVTELEEEDDVVVDMDAFRSLWLSYIDSDPNDPSANETTDGGIARKAVMDEIMNWIGTTYVYGGTSKSGIDCSAFTRAVFAGAGDVILPRTAATQWNVGRPIKNRSEMKFGDLVFFHTRKEVYVSHVGIYLGDNLFAHASSRYGVTVSSLESTYYDTRLIGVRRLEHRDLAPLATSDAKRYSY